MSSFKIANGNCIFFLFVVDLRPRAQQRLDGGQGS